MIYCVFICCWSVLMIKYWERKQSALAYYWFTSDLAQEEKVRREFYLAIDAIDSKKNISEDGLELPEVSDDVSPTTSPKKGEKKKAGGGKGQTRKTKLPP